MPNNDGHDDEVAIRVLNITKIQVRRSKAILFIARMRISSHGRFKPIWIFGERFPPRFSARVQRGLKGGAQ